MTTFGGTYTTGTITLTHGSTTAVGTGTLWAAVVEQYDLLAADGMVGLIDTVTDNTHIELAEAWAGADFTGTYVITLSSWLRYEPALTQQKVRALLADIDGMGWFYYVSGSVPDPDLGEEGQFALKVNSGAWQLWLKTGGVWVLQGTPAGVQWKGLWSSATTYTLNDVVHRLGKAYISLVSGANLNHAPESSPTQWDIFSIGGDTYDFLMWDNGRPTDSEVLIRAPMTQAIQFPVDLAGSQALAEVAATSTSVYSIQKNNVEFATITFAASSAVGVFASASGATFAQGDILKIVAPATRDTTLSGVAATITGAR